MLLAVNSSRREIVGFSAGDTAERNLTWLNWSFPIDISADGKTVLFNEQNIQPNGIYLRKLDGSTAVRLGEGGLYGFSPDGRWVLSVREENGSQFTLLPTGAGEPKELPKRRSIQSARWFRDGRRVLLSPAPSPDMAPGSSLQELPDGKPRAITPEGVHFIFDRRSRRESGGGNRSRSPNRHLSDRARRAPARARAGARRHPAPLERRWQLDLRLQALGASAASRNVDVATGRRTLWKEIRPPDPSGVEQVGPIVIAPDGASYVYSYRRALDELYLATGLR